MMTILPQTYEPPGISELPATVFVEGGVSPDRRDFRYPVIHSVEPFDRVILSPNGKVDQDAVIDFSAGSPAEGPYCLVSWAGPQAVPEVGQRLPPPVDTDVLQLARPTRELNIHSRLFSPGRAAGISRLGITLYHAGAEPRTHPGASVSELPEFAPVQLPVDFLSQFAAGTPEDDSLCCPTSATMVVRFWGVGVDLEEFSRLSYDPRHRIYGNWSLTAAVLSSFGLRAWIQKHGRLDELFYFVRAGQPVIVSVSFGPHELPGAPIKQTRGHLLVVRGFDDRGNVMVCDPAGRTVDEGMLVYDQQAFAGAWLGHGGIAIHAVPEKRIR
jgi:hypothetical protein